MSNKRYDQFSTVTPSSSRIMLHANPTTGALGKATIADLQLVEPSPFELLPKLAQFGVTPVAHVAGQNILLGGTALGITNNTFYLFPIPTKAFTATGIYYQLRVSGVFTANNFNGFALYEVQSGNYVKIAETANNANLFKATAQIYLKVAFTSTIALTNSIYWIAWLYNSSAVTTAPTIIGTNGSVFDFMKNMDASSSMTIVGSRASVNTLPTSMALNYLTGTASGLFWCGLY